MKIGLPLKLGIFVVLLFAVVIAACMLRTPVKMQYYLVKLRSDNPEERVKGVDGLLAMGEKGLDALAKKLDGNMAAAEFLVQYWKIHNVLIKSNKGPQIPQFFLPNPGLFPLHLAVKNNYYAVTSLFLDKGADVNSAYTIHELDPNGHAEPSIITTHRGEQLTYIIIKFVTPVNLATNEKMNTLLRSHGGKTGAELTVERMTGEELEKEAEKK